MPRTFPTIRLSKYAAAAILCLSIAVAPGMRTADAQSMAPDGLLRIQQIQQMLIGEGFDPGPADGVLGGRTVTALLAFQRRAGLPQTGRPDAAVFDALATRAAARANPAANAAPASAPPAPAAAGTSPEAPEAPSPLADTRWQLVDESGAQRILALGAGGEVLNVTNPGFWKWQATEDGIRIEYQNGVGGWVRRTGRFTGPDSIAGTASSSRDRAWRWTGKRLNGS